MVRWAVTQGPAGSGVTGSLLFSSVLWKRGLQESASPLTLLSREAKEAQGAAPLFSIVGFQQSCISALLPGQRLTVAALGLPLMPCPPKTMESSETLVLLSGDESKKGCQIVFVSVFVFSARIANCSCVADRLSRASS